MKNVLKWAKNKERCLFLEQKVVAFEKRFSFYHSFTTFAEHTTVLPRWGPKKWRIMWMKFPVDKTEKSAYNDNRNSNVSGVRAP